jgi:hypothetical protein
MKKAKIILSLIGALAMSFLFAGILAGAGLNDAVAPITLILFTGGVILGLNKNNMAGIAFACGSIAAGITTDCTNIPTPGIQTTIWLANFADIDTITVDSTNKTLATAITMKSGKVFFAFVGIKRIGKAGYKSNAGTFLNTLEHNLEIVILQNDPVSKGILDQMVNGSLVAIVQNKTTGTAGNMKYEIYGRESGLETLPERDTDNADVKGGHLLKMATPAGQQENHLPTTLFMTDESTTDAIIATITTP